MIKREGKYLYDFFTEKNYRSAVPVTERWSNAKGSIYLIPQIEVDH